MIDTPKPTDYNTGEVEKIITDMGFKKGVVGFLQEVDMKTLQPVGDTRSEVVIGSDFKHGMDVIVQGRKSRSEDRLGTMLRAARVNTPEGGIDSNAMLIKVRDMNKNEKAYKISKNPGGWQTK